MEQNSLNIYNQSGVIPYTIDNGSLKLLLISTRNRKRWTFPKGIIEEDLSPVQSAEQEAYEEAGIRGKVFPDQIGEYQYEKWGGTCTVQLYLQKVEKILDHWPEESFRQRRWVLISEALSIVEIHDLREIIKKLPVTIEQNLIKSKIFLD